MRTRNLVLTITGSAVLCAALGVGGGYLGASLNPAHNGARGVQGVSGKNGTNATVGTLGICVDGNATGNTYYIDSVSPAYTDKDKSIVCQSGNFVTVKPAPEPTSGG